MEEKTEESDNSKLKYVRCLEWLQNQNDPKKLSQQNKNDIQFIIETNAHSKKFFLPSADDVTVPAGIDEPTLEPKAVPIRRLREDNLVMLCEWQSCRTNFTDYELYQKHVANHSSDLQAIDVGGKVDYKCLWDVCGHRTSDFDEMIRHINYHAYHARLLAIGFNGRATLKLEKCKKDSTKRNQLPFLKNKHRCMWVGCTESYNSIQAFFNHMKQHINCYDDNDSFICSWAGCGTVFSRRTLLTMHLRTHTREKLIACFHCGQHFSCNSTIIDHALRQNVEAGAGFPCSICGTACASEYLLREHERQHVSAYACALCDMSAPSPAALAHHVRYRHLAPHTRAHACPHCDYRAVTKSDLRKHIPTHTKKKKSRKRKKDDSSESDTSDDSEKATKTKTIKKYACHICPVNNVKVFSRGTRLTSHLVKVHGAQWPSGHSRFRYQISDDGMYRLTTTRFEFEDVSKKIVDGYSWPKESLTNEFEFDFKRTADATETTPQRFEITLKNSDMEIKADDIKKENNSVEITMCDVDEHGNIISSATITCSDVFT